MASVCVHTSTFLRLSRSTHTPAKGATRKVGIWPAKLTVPSSSAEPVSRYTSHDVAMRVIQVPMSEIVWPPKNSRKLRCRNERHACAMPAVSVRDVELPAKKSSSRKRRVDDKAREFELLICSTLLL